MYVHARSILKHTIKMKNTHLGINAYKNIILKVYIPVDKYYQFKP